ncbi:hypothetical protein M8J76_015929 [Diaphorina citri]|nr:hypothetical protein M8J76_015929 [Diaphorina citri]
MGLLLCMEIFVVDAKHLLIILATSRSFIWLSKVFGKKKLISGCDSCTYLSIAATSEEIPNTPLSGCELRFGM